MVNRFTDIDAYYYKSDQTIYLTMVKGDDFTVLVYLENCKGFYRVFNSLTDLMDEENNRAIAEFEKEYDLDKYLETFKPDEYSKFIDFDHINT